MTEYMRVCVTVEQTRQATAHYDVDRDEYLAWLNGDEHSNHLLLEFIRSGRDYPDDVIPGLDLPQNRWLWDVLHNEITEVEA